MRITEAIAASLLNLVAVPALLAAQAVSGIVAVVETAERISGAEVTLVDEAGVPHAVVVSGQNGDFVLDAPEPGTYHLRVRRIGYKATSAKVVLESGRVIEVRVNLAPQATELEGITVYGLTAETPEQREFLSRRHLPWNSSLDKREIEQLQVASVGEAILFGIPFKPLCQIVYLDGRRINAGLVSTGNSELPLDWVYGIEVYRTYYDIPLRYREPSMDTRCGAVLLWSTTPPGYGLGISTVYSAAVGASSGWERAMAEIAVRPGSGDGYASTVRLRVGWHSAAELLGSTMAASEGVDPEKGSLYGSLYAGKQGPAPLLPWRRAVYSRVGLGASLYVGQPPVEAPGVDSTVVLESSTPNFFGVGGEVALGVRLPTGAVRPWIEVRTGTEWVMRAGMRWVRPALMVGLEFGGGPF